MYDIGAHLLMKTQERTLHTYVVFEVLTTVVLKSTIFWGITPYSSLRVNRRFRGTFRRHLHGQKLS
jgi:hypothetical protein